MKGAGEQSVFHPCAHTTAVLVAYHCCVGGMSDNWTERGSVLLPALQGCLVPAIHRGFLVCGLAAQYDQLKFS